MKPTFESLESRNLLSCGSVTNVTGAFGDLAIIQGTRGNDRISVDVAPNGALTATVNDVTTVLPSTTRFLYISGGAGNDRLENNTGLQSAIHGGSGRDRIIGGSGFNSLFGDTGKDTITGNPDDFIQEEPDSPSAPPQIPDLGSFVVLYGTEGNDTFEINPSSRGQAGEVSVVFNGLFETFVQDYYTLVIDGAGGNDVVRQNTDAIQTVVLDQC